MGITYYSLSAQVQQDCPLLLTPVSDPEEAPSTPLSMLARHHIT